jgi:hypothetical protein
VWFLWEGATCLVYSTPAARRLRHVRSRPAVALHFDRGDSGTIVIAGQAAVPDDQPPADRVPAFLAKYGHRMGMGGEAGPATSRSPSASRCSGRGGTWPATDRAWRAVSALRRTP